MAVMSFPMASTPLRLEDPELSGSFPWVASDSAVILAVSAQLIMGVTVRGGLLYGLSELAVVKLFA
jgi:hypothetical protein